MEKFTFIGLAITASAISFSTTAEQLSWALKYDTILDGILTTPSETQVTGSIFTKHFYFENITNPEDNFTTGNIETNSLDVGAGSLERINFTTYRDGNSIQYSGHTIGNGIYQGVWYNGIGDSGDFTLDTNEMSDMEPLEPFNPATATVIGSTQYSQHPASAVLDGALGNNNTNVWIGLTDDSAPSLIIQLAESRTFTKYRLSRGYCSAEAYVAGTWKLYGSDNNTSYQIIDTVDVDQGGIMNCTSLTEFTIDNPNPYLYYKFEFEMSSVNTYTHTGVAIGELEFDE